MTTPLQRAFVAASPRFQRQPTPMRAWLIHGSVAVLWLLLFAAAFGLQGLGAWSVGIAYVVYDTVLLGFVGWQTWALFRASSADVEQPRDITVDAPCSLAVIVAARNEVLALPLTLNALLEQTDRADCIVIADDGSTDGTADLLATRYGLEAPVQGRLGPASASHPGLRWLRLPHGGKARALNAALGQIDTDTDTVLTVDADTLLEPGAVAAVRRAFDRESALVAATGIIAPVCGRSWSGRCFQWFQTYEYIRNFLSRYAWMRVNALLLVSGAFAAFRLDALRAVGGFDARSLVEDYELIHRLRHHALANGLDWRVRVLGDAQARTDAPDSIGAFLRQRRRWFGGFLQTQYWYRSMVGDRRHGWLGVAMLPVKAIDTLQPFYGLAAFALLVVFIVRGNLGVLGPVALVIGGKIAIDLAFHLWSVVLYRRWVGPHGHSGSRIGVGQALLAALVEPFTFQLLRHSGAALGWWTFLRGGATWGASARSGVVGEAPLAVAPASPAAIPPTSTSAL